MLGYCTLKKNIFGPKIAFSLLCNLSKVMEQFVHSQLHDYLFNNGLIYKRQSAYSPNDSK